MSMKNYIKKILLLSFILLALTGCKPLWGFNWFGLADTTTDSDFMLDNDTVFDLFQDDFGTGTQYDDRFTDDPTELDLPDDNPAANDPGPTPSTTVDPSYDEIGSMTPDELSKIGIVKIPVLLISGHEIPFPAKQFGDLSGIDKCDHLHYHGASGFSLDLKNVPEPDNPCGFDNKVTQRTVTGQQMIDWFHNKPRNF